ncbi:MAG: amidohydrolase [Candidatus Freyarchaeota archaeon]|nr:amidohydrolase [Candidatus Jordarchaeia archaeon]
MLVVDAHTHIVDEGWMPKKWWDELAKVYVHALGEIGVSMTVDQVKSQIFPNFYDPDASKLIREMDAAGIDVSVICPLDYGLALGDPPTPIEEQNQIFAEVQKKHPKRIIAFVSVDPRRPDAEKIVRAGLEELGLRGLKLHPASGFYPNDPCVYKLLSIAKEFNVPVLFHTGQIVQPLRSKYCNPIYLDDVLLDFPELTVQAAHMSFGWRHELFHMGATKTNLVVDFSGWQIIARSNFKTFCEALRECMDEFGASRVLFGTDGPYLRAAMPDKDFVEAVKNLPKKAPEGITFTEKEIEAIMGGNAKRIYKL